MEKRTHSDMTEGERETDIVCLERWPRDKLEKIKRLLLPEELKNKLDDIHLEPGADRVKVRYSTCTGDVDGRVYGTIVYYSKWYKNQVAKKGETFNYMNDYPREEEQPGGVSLQRIDKWIRRLLAYEYYHDYDIENCAPVLLAQIIEKEGFIVPPELIAYNTQRETIFNHYRGRIDLGEVKKSFLKVLHMGGEDHRIPETVRLKRALRATLLLLSKKDDRHQALYDKCRDECEKDSKKKKFSYLKDKEEAKVTNTLGRFCAAVWQREEHKILMSMRAYFISQGYHTQRMTLCFDGLMVEKRESDATDMVNFEELSDFIQEKTGFKVTVSEKSLKPTENDLAIYEGRVIFEKK